MKKNFPNTRLRRLRLTKSIRNLIRENSLSPCDLIQPIFLIEGKSKIEKIKTMPDIFRFTIDKAIESTEDVYIIAVQFNPEIRGEMPPHFDKLFTSLIKACKKTQNSVY